MLIAKDFRFEAAHRIPWHEGACRHLHGHSYGLTVVLEGQPDERGMVMDFRHVKSMLADLVDAMDHSVLASEDDHELRGALAGLGGKVCLLPYDSTAENLCRFVADHLLRHGTGRLQEHRVSAITVRIWETSTCYAELRVPVTVGVTGEIQTN